MKLRSALRQYIDLKRSLGYRFCSEAVILTAFGKAMGATIELRRVRPASLRTYLDGQGPITRFWERKRTALRGFYRYAMARGWVARSPLPVAIPKMPPPFVPYIFSPAELRKLLEAVATIPPRCFSRTTLRTLLLLLYGAGLRISEALNLCDLDADLSAGVLTIRCSKFFKTRSVPIAPRLAALLSAYRGRRPSTRNRARRPFFLTRKDTPIRRGAIEGAFRALCRAAGIQRTDGARYQPRLHDLRHTFAVHRLIAAYRKGANVQRLLPLLSTYLGHADLAATQRYLTLTPELAQEAARRFERYAFCGGDRE